MTRSPFICLTFLFFSIPASGSDLEFDWSGHLRTAGFLDNYSNNHFLTQTNTDQNFYNLSFDGRINASFYSGERTSFHFAYEAALTGGETRKAISELSAGQGDRDQSLLVQLSIPSDAQQFFSLTKIIAEEDGYLLYHRIDRMFLAYDSQYGNLSIGRQPLTWGNGMLFNPADLINPFAPSDIIRDYKIGSDMILFQRGADLITDFQLVAVPRRDLQSDTVEFSESTLGMKIRLSHEQKDFDLYVLKNYEDPVLGTGFVTYLGDGVLRSDLTWTYLDDDPDRDSFFSGVINYDYSWSWGEKNWYGLLEFYYNGLGSSNALQAFENESLRKRLLRGEIFVTGNHYLDGLVQFEAHPLVNIFTTIIYNLDDNSFLLQPRLTWDFNSSWQLLVGCNIAVGSLNTEFGELELPEKNSSAGQANQAYLLVTAYF